MTEHDCTFCDHFTLDEGWSGTEVTGGEPARIGCGKYHWTLGDGAKRGEWTTKEFRLAVVKGETCADFKRTGD